MKEKTETLTEKEKALLALAHEIRNPLTAIKMSNQLLQENLENEKTDKFMLQSFAMIISDNIEKAENNLKQLLNYRYEKPVLQPVNICDILNEAINQLGDRLYLSGIELHKNYEGNHWINGDAEALTRSFVNIVTNSIEAMKVDKGKIWINLHATNNNVRITFKDNGMGMESGIADHIFEPYFSDKKNGTGIGLFHVKEIMNLHQAQILADSLPDVGTSISILFKSIPAEQVRHTSKGSTRTSSL